MRTLLVNISDPMVQNFVNLSQGAIVDGGETSKTGELVKQMFQHIYVLALFSQKSFDADSMKAFIER